SATSSSHWIDSTGLFIAEFAMAWQPATRRPPRQVRRGQRPAITAPFEYVFARTAIDDRTVSRRVWHGRGAGPPRGARHAGVDRRRTWGEHAALEVGSPESDLFAGVPNGAEVVVPLRIC